MLETVKGLSKLAAEMEMTPATLAVAMAGRYPAVLAPILCARSVEQLTPPLAAQDVTLSDELYARIEALSPRPAPATDRLEEAAA
ncbi:MAG: aldo/keto reductase [Roseovarius sp.]|nr:aldo/keto reductase [Roseovarius sp.]